MFQRGDLMVHKPTLKQACQWLIHYKKAVGLSPHTILDYEATFKKLLEFFDEETLMAKITRKAMVEFFAWGVRIDSTNK
jgi:hypothetical protein